MDLKMNINWVKEESWLPLGQLYAVDTAQGPATNQQQS